MNPSIDLPDKGRRRQSGVKEPGGIVMARPFASSAGTAAVVRSLGGRSNVVHRSGLPSVLISAVALTGGRASGGVFRQLRCPASRSGVA